MPLCRVCSPPVANWSSNLAFALSNFCKANANRRGVMRARGLYSVIERNDAIMNTILLLKEKAEPADRVSHDLKQSARDGDNSTPGRTCDRWGHPMSGLCPIQTAGANYAS